MGNPLTVNLKARVLLLVTRYGINELGRAAVFAKAIEDVVDQAYPQGRPTLRALEPLISEQLVLLESALNAARAGAGLSDAGVYPPAEPEPEPQVEEQPVEVEEPRRRRQILQGESRCEAKSMEEKLRDEREPLQKLLGEDCVRVGLIDQKQAKAMIRSMLGKQPQEAEQEIVEKLRQALQDQVRATIRKHKNSPWSKPAAQEQLRQDIHCARSVKGVVMMARQIAKELKDWKKSSGKGGLLSMFG